MPAGLIIVSNRLPVSVKKVDGKLEFFSSAGGLATGLASYADDKNNKWIGWPGIASDEINEKERQHIADELKKNNCYPVFLSQQQLDDFYNGYSNSVLWPIFHDGDMREGMADEQSRLWPAYQEVNQQFAEAVLALSDNDDTVWVHDYQLLVLPALLRLERPQARIGYFLHIPFPDYEQFGKIAEGEALLAGILGADLIGFHVGSYVKNFLEAVDHSDIGISGTKKVILPGRVVRVTDFPMGIDYTKYEKARKSRAVSREYAKLRLQYAGQKVILTVDRLDPAKNLVGKVQAYQTLLKENPKLRGHVVMVMLVVPSRTDIAEYKQLKDDLETAIDETNATFGLLPWVPIEYLFTALPFERVTALYRRADVAFIAPLRDGMNLVAKEYLASKPYQRGVLVLSKTAGAAEELKGAVMVDPARPATLVKGLKRAIEMPQKEFKTRVRRMQKQLSAGNVHVWAKSFTKTLNHELGLPGGRTHALQGKALETMLDDYKQAERKLLLLDYDGVLAPFVSRPEDAKPSEEMVKVLRKIGKSAHCELVIISGRERQSLDQWFSDWPVSLVAEHGIFTKAEGRQHWRTTPNDALIGWQSVVRPILEKYAALAPGSFVESKSADLVWHYRQANPYNAQKYLVILKRLLEPLSDQYGLQVRQGNKILEVRPTGINKGTSAFAWLQKTDPHFVLAVGDDYTDEEMFTALPPQAYTLKIGPGRTAARYRLKNTREVLALLETIAKLS